MRTRASLALATLVALLSTESAQSLPVTLQCVGGYSQVGVSGSYILAQAGGCPSSAKAPYDDLSAVTALTQTGVTMSHFASDPSPAFFSITFNSYALIALVAPTTGNYSLELTAALAIEGVSNVPRADNVWNARIIVKDTTIEDTEVLKWSFFEGVPIAPWDADLVGLPGFEAMLLPLDAGHTYSVSTFLTSQAHESAPPCSCLSLSNSLNLELSLVPEPAPGILLALSIACLLGQAAVRARR